LFVILESEGGGNVVSTEGIRGLVEPVLASIGLELWDVEVARDVVRIMVERSSAAGEPGGMADPSAPFEPSDPSDPSGPSDPPGGSGPGRGIDLDALSDASSVLSPVLDAHPEAVPAGRYQLEVSSPGIERALRTPEQFRRYLGAEITVKTSEPVAGARRHRGRILEVGTAGIDLQPDADPDGRLQLRFDLINRARTVMEWGPGVGRPAPGHSVPGQAAPGRLSADRRAPGRQPVSGMTSIVPTSKDPAP
jgi:ribosome maturation factor RimP